MRLVAGGIAVNTSVVNGTYRTATLAPGGRASLEARVTPSANTGDTFTLVEPVHGSAPDIAGKGIANPIATILAAAQLLEALGELHAAQQVQSAVRATLAAGILSPELGGSATTEAVTNEVVGKL